jgi:hypothetical protein
MRIPIDRYSILGVSLGSDSRIILNQLERKLEKSDYPGFSIETLEKRSEVLKECSNILLDIEKRIEYDKEYTTKNNISNRQPEPETIISKGQEIAGLLLLLEAGRHEECIGMAENLYREQRMSMSYFSSEYKEINRIIDYATLGLAKNLKHKRHYETAAEILERRINSQTVGMGEKERISDMVSELKSLLPFRVLDTLSRDNDERAHLKGIGLLKAFVRERGGLEADSKVHMDKNEFFGFFKQIRTYLTVQEQVKLFEEWSIDGSKAAVFLTCISLTAQGFAQRKPHKINFALKKLEQMNAQELEPILANMHLLLGNVESATQIFENCADQDLKEWALKRTKDPLGGLCEWCREWLKRDVLKGYRDIDIEADLESYFADKDVIEYIENQDGHEDEDRKDQQIRGDWDRQINKKKVDKQNINLPNNTRNRVGSWQLDQFRNNLRKMITENLLVFLIIAISSCSLLLFRTLSSQDGVKSEPEKVRSIKRTLDTKKEVLGTQEQLNQTLVEWLQVKKQSLETNQLPNKARKVATPRMLEQLRQETEQNRRKGQTQIMNVEIKKIILKDEAPKKASINAQLKYQDKTINRRGEILTETITHDFERMYNFIWNGSRWIIDR